jgi:hypothetical protein
MKCKCGNVEKIYIDVEESNGPGKYSLTNTFFCKDCDSLTTIDTVKQKLVCGNCRGNKLTKMFVDGKVKCRKCGKNGFGALNNIFD